MTINRRALINAATWPLSDKAYLHLLYFLKNGRFPNLKAPQLFNEKLLWRILYDRRPIFRQVEDKIAARQYVTGKGLGHLLTTQYFVGDDPERIPFDDLPQAFVAKPSHTSGYVQLVPDKRTLDRENLLRTCRRWLNINYYRKGREWQYRGIPRKIIVEEHLGDGLDGATYHFHSFHGEPRVVYVRVDRFRPGDRRSYYTPDWEIEAADSDEFLVWDVPRPKHLDEMLEAARTLSADFDYIRVDFYDLPDRIVFNEFAVTPGNGLAVSTGSLQTKMGAWWKLDTSRVNT